VEEEINRRPLLKAIGAGAGTGVALGLLPKSWMRPVVQSVIVPAHAAASPSVTTTTASPTTTVAPTTTVPATTGAPTTTAAPGTPPPL